MQPLMILWLLQAGPGAGSQGGILDALGGLSGLLWLLAIGAFFYLMMRGGCGAGMVHGGHGDHGAEYDPNPKSKIQNPKSKDPVCGMEVAPGEGYSKAYEGREYRFCSRDCLDKFDTEPQRYLSAAGASQATAGDQGAAGRRRGGC